MRFVELFDSPEEYKITKNNDEEFKAVFKVGKLKYTFLAIIDLYEKEWMVAFKAEGRSLKDPEEATSETDKNYLMTNTGGEVKVFSTIAACFKDFIKLKRPLKFVFSADFREPQREKLYDLFAKRIVKEFPQYEFEKADNYETYYYFSKKKSKRKENMENLDHLKDRSKQFIDKLIQRTEGSFSRVEEVSASFKDLVAQFEEVFNDLIEAKNKYIDILEKYNHEHKFNLIPDSSFSGNLVNDVGIDISGAQNDSKDLIELKKIIDTVNGDFLLAKSQVGAASRDLIVNIRTFISTAVKANDYLDAIINNEEVYGTPETKY
jgi:hypothetical protein